MRDRTNGPGQLDAEQTTPATAAGSNVTQPAAEFRHDLAVPVDDELVAAVTGFTPAQLAEVRRAAEREALTLAAAIRLRSHPELIAPACPTWCVVDHRPIANGWDVLGVHAGHIDGSKVCRGPVTEHELQHGAVTLGLRRFAELEPAGPHGEHDVVRVDAAKVELAAASIDDWVFVADVDQADRLATALRALGDQVTLKDADDSVSCDDEARS